jgi:Tfp pilus assembly protein PilO
MNKQTLTVLIVAISLLASGGIIYKYIIPTQEKNETLDSQVLEIEAKTQKISKKIRSIEQASAQKTEIESYEKIANQLVPGNPELNNFLIEMEAFINQTNIANTTFDLPGINSKQTSAAVSKTSVVPGAQTAQFSISLRTSLVNISTMLEKLKNLNRLTEISTITINAGEDQNGLSCQLQGNIFYKTTSSTSLAATPIEKLLSEADQKLNSNPTYGKPIEIERETGFGKSNPFQ